MVCELCDEYLDEYYNIDPIINDFFMKEEWKKNDYQPNIYSKIFNKKLETLYKKYLNKLKKKEELTFYDKILKRDIEYSLNNNHSLIRKYMPIDHINNILIQYSLDASGKGYYKFRNKCDFNNFLSRLGSLDKITTEIIMKMRDGIKNGVTLYFRTVDKIINIIKGIIKDKSYQNSKVLISKRKWNETIDKYLVKNLIKLNNFLINEYYKKCINKCGLHNYKGGKGLYKNIVKMETFQSATPHNLHKLGLSELKECNRLKDKLRKKLNVTNIDEFIINSKGDFYNKEEDIIKDLNKIQKDIINNVYSKNFNGKIGEDDKYDIKSIELRDSPHYAYYLSGDLKNENKGTFFINVSRPMDINKNELYILSLHEGIPGHHYQIHYNNNSYSPDYIKGNNYDAYSEGWALYCESLGDYKNHKCEYYRIQYNIHRSLRLIIDTGIHYYGWDYDRCFKLMKENLMYPDKYIHNELLRYIELPGQALTYKVGEKTIKYLRDVYLKEGYSIKDFHELIMGIGPCPLDILVNELL